MQHRNAAEQIGILTVVAAALIALAVYLLMRGATAAPAREYRDAAFVCAAPGGLDDV